LRPRRRARDCSHPISIACCVCVTSHPTAVVVCPVVLSAIWCARASVCDV
jgi:hypothetical protein